MFKNSSYLRSLPDSLRRFSLRFIHHRLRTGKCSSILTISGYIANSHSPLLPSYNYFISCSSFSTNKHSRLQTINKTLSSLYTPPLLQQYIIISHSKVYNVEFSPFKYSI